MQRLLSITAEDAGSFLQGIDVTGEIKGGELSIAWAGGNAPVLLTGPAVSVFDGEIEI